MSWWVPLAFVGAGIVGIGIALSLASGRPRTSTRAPEAAPRHGGRPRSRYEEDNELRWNPAAFVAAIALVAVIVLIAVVIAAS